MNLLQALFDVLPGTKRKEREEKIQKLLEENQILTERLTNLEKRHSELLQKFFYGRVALEQDIIDLYKMYEEGTLNRMHDPIKSIVYLYTYMVCTNLGFESPIPPEVDA